MTTVFEFAVRSILIGTGATWLMDLWAALLRRVGVPSLNFALLGRWIGHWLQGRWFHQSIAQSPPIRRERLIGWFAHYSIGVSFAGLLLGVFGLGWSRSPTLVPALLVGVATVVAPLFILQPALGSGIASSKTSKPLFNSVKSLVTHIVFGIGLFLSARGTAGIDCVADRNVRHAVAATTEADGGGAFASLEIETFLPCQRNARLILS